MVDVYVRWYVVDIILRKHVEQVVVVGRDENVAMSSDSLVVSNGQSQTMS